MKVIFPIRKSIQIDVEILKETALIVLALDGHSQATPHAGINAIRRDQISAANQLLLIASINVCDPRGDAVRIQRQVLKCGVVFNGLAKVLACVIADKRLGLALAVGENAVVAGIHRGVIETRTHFRSLALAKKMHDVSFAPEIAIEDTFADFLIDKIEHLDGAGVHRNSAGLPARTRHALDASIFDTAARQFHRQHAAYGAATNDQDRDFTDFGHCWTSSL